ncbi:MAG TPA: depupylase/deamidase Dop [Acidimicrobiales bacterium]|nr:depupylase/deamidase Dop [Acidimicrobiales bacterium]
MAVAKVCGTETEYGVLVSGPAVANPTLASSLLINSYVAERDGRVGWDFEDESPGRDARGFVRDGALAPEVETHLVNTVLTNGARYYVDHAHPEYSSPECSNPLELVVHDRAGEVVLERSMAAANRLLPAGEEIVVYKNNSDGKGNSYGCHENYLMDRATPFSRIARELTAHLVTRQVYTGSGKVGCELEHGARDVFEISQRADFFEEEIGLETTLKRPIINTRDEPHADAQAYRRLHVITGDANLAEVATLLKVGVTAIVLVLIEEGALAGRELVLASPVSAMRAVSHDLTLRAPIELVDGTRLTALELQWELYDRARKHAAERGLEAVGPEQVVALVLERWESVLASLECAPSLVKHQLDWVAKYELIDAYCARHGCGLGDARVRALDLQYHDLRPARSLQRRLSMERLVAEEDVLAAVSDPPRTTRAYFRGECLKRFASSIVAANWDSLVFDLGEDPLRRVPMMEPLRGTESHVATLLRESKSPAELLRRLGG